VLDYRALLEGARPLPGRSGTEFDVAFERVAKELRAPQRRRHAPLRYIRPGSDLGLLREAAVRLDSEFSGSPGVSLIRELMLGAYPRVFDLRDRTRLDDGRRVAAVATAGAWSDQESTIAAVLDLEVAMANDTVRETAFTHAEVWAKVVPPGAAGAQACFDLAEVLRRIGLQLAQPAEVPINVPGARPSRGLWIGRPPDWMHTPPVDWPTQVIASARTLGLNLTVAEYPAARLNELIRTAEGSDILVAWAPNPTREVAQIVAAHEAAQTGRRAVMIAPTDFDAALEAFWLEVDDRIDRWAPAPIDATLPIPEDKNVYLQKSGSGGDHDFFSVRASACTHGKFFAVHHAEKGVKGVERMYGVRPTTIYKCSEPGCSCWRAAFD
jgi:hypothetical protein